MSYFPYGEERVTRTADGTERFGTYQRDAGSGLDYAMNRHYSSTVGRFMSPDPYEASAGVAEPQSWNRYGYVQNDPVNFRDPRGLMNCRVDWDEQSLHCDDSMEMDMELLTGPMTDPGGDGGGSGPAERLGVTRASDAMRSVANADFRKKPDCMKLLNALAGQSGKDVDDFAVLIANYASDAAGYIYDGPSSSTPLAPDKFPGAGTGLVGDWFKVYDGRLALSQYNGSAVFIRASAWEGVSGFTDWSGALNSYGKGTMMHELLHKAGFGFDPLDSAHSWFTKAVKAAGLSGDFATGRNRESDILGRLCF
jgi:RHS repeat-associated protein